MILKCSGATSRAVAEEAMWLAWNECGGPLGMGFLQNNPGATKADVIKNIVGAEDYPGGRGVYGFRPSDELYADYVFGRMMKLGFGLPSDTEIRVSDYPPRHDYQGWSGNKYPSYRALVDAAAKNLSATLEEIVVSK